MCMIDIEEISGFEQGVLLLYLLDPQENIKLLNQNKILMKCKEKIGNIGRKERILLITKLIKAIEEPKIPDSIHYNWIEDILENEEKELSGFILSCLPSVIYDSSYSKVINQKTNQNPLLNELRKNLIHQYFPVKFNNKKNSITEYFCNKNIYPVLQELGNKICISKNKYLNNINKRIIEYLQKNRQNFSINNITISVCFIGISLNYDDIQTIIYSWPKSTGLLLLTVHKNLSFLIEKDYKRESLKFILTNISRRS